MGPFLYKFVFKIYSLMLHLGFKIGFCNHFCQSISCWLTSQYKIDFKLAGTLNCCQATGSQTETGKLKWEVAVMEGLHLYLYSLQYFSWDSSRWLEWLDDVGIDETISSHVVITRRSIFLFFPICRRREPRDTECGDIWWRMVQLHCQELGGESGDESSSAEDNW